MPDLFDQMADVLVNTVVKGESSVTRCFLRAGGKQLQQVSRRVIQHIQVFVIENNNNSNNNKFICTA